MYLEELIKRNIIILFLVMSISRISSFAMDERKLIVEEEIEHNRSIVYAEYYVKLKLENGVNEEQARKLATIYEEKIQEVKSSYYVDYYIKLREKGISEKEAKKQAMIYVKERSNGRSSDYVEYYLKLITERLMSKSQAMRQADIFC